MKTQKTKKKRSTSKYTITEKYDLKPKRSSAGLGLFTFSPIKKGACVIEYVGPVISAEEEMTSNSLYLFEVTKTVTIDGRARSNLARYINHSCRPNCEVEVYKRRVYVMARRNIKPGEELTYDYGWEYWNEHIGKNCRCPSCVADRKRKESRK